MLIEASEFYSLKNLIDQEIQLFLNSNEKAEKKEDESWVTLLDLKLSQLIKEQLVINKEQSNKHKVCFYSEEDYSELFFPALIVDPIDGTRGLVDRTFESTVSIGFMKSFLINDKANEYFLYQPFSIEIPLIDNEKIWVSRSEFNKGMFDKREDVVPMGSIALKLLLLGQKKGGAVYSLRPKNIWDIAAGTIFLGQQGYSFFSEGEEVTRLDKKLYKPPLVWGKKDFLKKKKLI